MKAAPARSNARRNTQQGVMAHGASTGLKHGTRAMSGSAWRTTSPSPIAAAGLARRKPPLLFERWLELFDETCRELFDEELAADFHAKAARIADSLQLALFYRPDRPWPPAAP